MSRILVIQLGRLGDVIQTTPLLRELLAQNRDKNGIVDVLVLDSLREIVGGLGLGVVHGLSEGSLPVSLRQLDNSIELSRTRHEPITFEAEEVLRRLALPRYDCIVNCTYSPIGALVAQHARGEQVSGPVINADGEVLFHHPAHIYLCARANFREQNWFNLVDLWRAGGLSTGTKLKVTRSYVPIASKLPFDIPSGRIVALNPGASDSARRWPAANFALLAERLVSRGLVPALVGAPSDRDTCAEVQARSSVKIANFCGQTSVPQLALFLTRADLLVSNDTGAIHIAAAAGCRVLALFGATAYFAETAPWAEGHVILQGPVGPDVVLLHPQLVLAAAQWRLGLIDEMDLRREIVLHKVTGWETFYLQPNEDSLGGIAYRPLHKDNLSPEELFTRELRHLFARVFCQDEQTSSEGNLLQGVAPYTGTAGSGQPVVYGNENMRFFNTLESMAAAAERCRFLCVKPTSPAAAEISSLSSSLVRAIEELKIYSEGCTKLKPVVHFLDWSCRMMEPMSAERTFHAHAQAYRLAARLVREASLNTKQLIEGVSAAACLS